LVSGGTPGAQSTRSAESTLVISGVTDVTARLSSHFGLVLLIFLPLLHWDSRHVPPCPVL
jgi:hypothetical protein